MPRTFAATGECWVGPNLTPIHRRPSPTARMRLFCLPFAGAGASAYSTWQVDFHDDIEVCAVELPGRNTRSQEPPICRAGPLAAQIVRDLAPYLDLPFAVFGHSLGAILAFELARALRRNRFT